MKVEAPGSTTAVGTPPDAWQRKSNTVIHQRYATQGVADTHTHTYVCIWLCIYIYIYPSISISISISLSISISISIYIYIYICVCVCIFFFDQALSQRPHILHRALSQCPRPNLGSAQPSLGPPSPSSPVCIRYMTYMTYIQYSIYIYICMYIYIYMYIYICVFIYIYMIYIWCIPYLASPAIWSILLISLRVTCCPPKKGMNGHVALKNDPIHPKLT